MSLALAFDDLLHHPDLAEIIEDAHVSIHAAGYSWLLDQAHAATRHTHNVLTAAAAANGSTVLNLSLDQHPDWVRLGFLTTMTNWVTGRAATCTHSPDPARPQPVFGAAWKPDLVVCSACIHLLRLRKGSPKDRTCDGCGTVVDNDSRLWANAAVYGAFTHHVGVCESCRYWPLTSAAA